MLDGVNDSPAQAERCSRWCAATAARRRAAVQVQPDPVQPVRRSRACSARRRERVAAFAAVLQEAGIVTTVRKTRGDDIAAACGQLAGEVQDRTRVAERRARAVPVPIARAAVAPARAATASRRDDAHDAAPAPASRRRSPLRWRALLAACRACRRRAVAAPTSRATASPPPTSPRRRSARARGWSSRRPTSAAAR